MNTIIELTKATPWTSPARPVTFAGVRGHVAGLPGTGPSGRARVDAMYAATGLLLAGAGNAIDAGTQQGPPRGEPR